MNSLCTSLVSTTAKYDSRINPAESGEPQQGEYGATGHYVKSNNGQKSIARSHCGNAYVL